MNARWLWIVVALAGSACGGWSAASEGTGSAPVAPATSLDKARAYERGTGVARDYHAAAEIYRAACNQGRGDLVACDALIRAHLHARGVDGQQPAGRQLADAVCLARHDPFACVAADVLADRVAGTPQPLRDTITDVAGNLELCDVTHLSDCRARLLVSAEGHKSRWVEHQRRQLRLQSCRAGILEGCAEVVKYARANTELGEAARQLQIACDAHDAEACAAAPGRKPIALAELCTAADYEACARLGCAGDATAGQRAVSHGVNVSECSRFESKPQLTGTEAVVAKMTEFKDKMCVCADRPCVDVVTEEMTHWGQEQARNASADRDQERISEEDTKAIASVTEDMTRCMTRAMMAGQPTTPPP